MHSGISIITEATCAVSTLQQQQQQQLCSLSSLRRNDNSFFVRNNNTIFRREYESRREDSFEHQEFLCGHDLQEEYAR
eukprot:scaffold22588_cov114-Cylindrotheca_fusiformis.AAC.5